MKVIDKPKERLSLTGESLLFTSAIFVGLSLVFAILIIIYDKKKSQKIREYALVRHGKNSIFTLDVRRYVPVFLIYIATAFAADIALEWLSSLALLCFFSAIVVNRLCEPAIMQATQKDGIDPEDVPEKTVSTHFRERRFKRFRLPLRTPEPLGKILAETASLLATIVGWTALADLVILFIMVLIETVIPHYVSLLGVVF